MISKLETLPESLVAYADRNKGTLWQIVKAYRANLRQGTVRVKTRSMVRSTGKKPYNQKKTGNARRGSFVSPLHVGGGVAHGPQPRDHRQAVPPKMGRAALGIALAERVKAGKVFVGPLSLPTGKTKDAARLLQGVREEFGATLICLSQHDEQTVRALRNLRGVQLVSPQCVNAFDLMQARVLVASEEAFQVIQNRLVSGGEAHAS